MTFQIKWPWGMWDLETGAWQPNHILRMSEEDQHKENLANGYSCEHRHNPRNCKYCNNK